MLRPATLVTVLTLAALNPLAAQSQPAPGSRVRIASPARGTRVIVEGTLVPTPRDSACLSVVRDVQTQRSCGKALFMDNDARLRGAVAFGLGGAVLGAVAGGIMGRERWTCIRLHLGASDGGGLLAGPSIRC